MIQFTKKHGLSCRIQAQSVSVISNIYSILYAYLYMISLLLGPFETIVMGKPISFSMNST